MCNRLYSSRIFNRSFRVGCGFTPTRFSRATSRAKSFSKNDREQGNKSHRVGQANVNFAGNEGNFPVEETKFVMKIFRTCVCMYVYTAYLFCRMC